MEGSKTALKWTENGELSSVDMARILEALKNEELTKCALKEKEQADVG
tara:strand:- start:3957 stop:4100 length:144 start_codon:yes stop_codon:yes gene_type:complete